MNKDLCPKRRGFTLVELLVVIGCIAILIGILMPVFGKARESSRAVVCMSNLRQWGLALQSYTNANKDIHPLNGGDGDTSGNPVGEWTNPALWFNALPPYVNGQPYCDMQTALIPPVGAARLPKSGDNNLFVCPSSSDAVQASADASGAATNGFFNVYGTVNGVSTRRATFICYVWNSKLDVGLASAFSKRIRLASIRNPTEVMTMIEKRMVPLEHKTNSTESLARLKTDRKRFAARHKTGGHVLFADSHVGFLTTAEVNTKGSTNDYNHPGSFVWSPWGSP